MDAGNHETGEADRCVVEAVEVAEWRGGVMGRIEEIEARLAAATPGPWAYNAPVTYRVSRQTRTSGWSVTSPSGAVVRANVDAEEVDGELFAHAPADLRYLLAVARGAG